MKKVARVVRFDRYFHVSQVFFWGLVLFAAPTVPASAQQQALQPQQEPKEHQQHNSDLPAGPGKDTFVRVCSKCHSPNNVMASGKNQLGWENTITKMVGFGAKGTDDEFSEILDYLVMNFPPQTGVKVNVNNASVSELETGLALSTKEAEGVIAYRDKNGDFKSLDDLKKVPLLDVKKLDAKKKCLAF